MAQYATMTVNDGKATPVTHSFTRDRMEPGDFAVSDKSGGIPSGFPSFQSGLTVNAQSGYIRVKMNFDYPVMNLTVPTAPIVGHVIRFRGEASASPVSTEADRLDAWTLFAGLLTKPPVKDQFVKLEASF